ncbi:hypothetical protein [Salinicola peritrichatus]|uniref:hypothetical protein n=1 Tax=Salinicola peritrichatus TaxID=1267424 RepID=UPI000DA23D08|nr:hypothetical protein [Salinicola peritrichatus]
MTILSAVARMLSATAQDWNLPRCTQATPYIQPMPRAQAGSVKSHQRQAAKRKARRRAKRLNHF